MRTILFIIALLIPETLLAQPVRIERNVARSKATLAAALAETGWKDGDLVTVQGKTSAGDGGGAEFIYNSSGWSGLTATQQGSTGFFVQVGATDAYLEIQDKMAAKEKMFTITATGDAVPDRGYAPTDYTSATAWATALTSALSALSTGDTLDFPANTNIAGEEFAITEAVTINGNNAFIKAANANQYIFSITGSDSGPTTVNGLHVDGGDLDGVAYEASAGFSITAGYKYPVVLKECKASNLPAGPSANGVYITGGDVILNDLYVENPGYAGVADVGFKRASIRLENYNCVITKDKSAAGGQNRIFNSNRVEGGSLHIDGGTWYGTVPAFSANISVVGNVAPRQDRWIDVVDISNIRYVDNYRGNTLGANGLKFTGAEHTVLSNISTYHVDNGYELSLNSGSFQISNCDFSNYILIGSGVDTLTIKDSQFGLSTAEYNAVTSSTTNATLASDFENGDTVNGVVLATGNYVLVTGQTDKSENGYYSVNASGAPTRYIFVDGLTDQEKIRGITVEVTGGSQQNIIYDVGMVAGSLSIGTDNILCTPKYLPYTIYNVQNSNRIVLQDTKFRMCHRGFYTGTANPAVDIQYDNLSLDFVFDTAPGYFLFNQSVGNAANSHFRGRGLDITNSGSQTVYRGTSNANRLATYRDLNNVIHWDETLGFTAATYGNGVIAPTNFDAQLYGENGWTIKNVNWPDSAYPREWHWDETASEWLLGSFRGTGTTAQRTSFTTNSAIGTNDAYLVEWYDTDNDALYTWDGSAWFLENAHGYAGISVENSITGPSFGGTQTNWGANKAQITDFDTDFASEFNADADHTNDHITLSSAGIWEVTATVTLAQDTAGDDFQFAIFKNNGATRLSIEHTVTGLRSTVTVGCLTSVSASDTIELWAQRTDGSDSFVITSASLCATKVSN